MKGALARPLSVWGSILGDLATKLTNYGEVRFLCVCFCLFV